MFADGYPYLLCSTASVDKVNEDVGSTVVSYRNFRPNILVDGVQKPYDEVSSKYIAFKNSTNDVNKIHHYLLIFVVNFKY